MKIRARLVTVCVLLLLVLTVSAVSCRGKGEEATPSGTAGTGGQGEAVEEQVDDIIQEIDSLLENLDPGAFEESTLNDQELGM